MERASSANPFEKAANVMPSRTNRLISTQLADTHADPPNEDCATMITHTMMEAKCDVKAAVGEVKGVATKEKRKVKQRAKDVRPT